PSQAEPGAFPAGQHRDGLPDVRLPEEEGAGHLENFLVLLAPGRPLVQVLQHGLALREAGVDVLGVDADLAAVPPADLPSERLERVHHRPQERRLALPVVTDDGRPRAVVDLQLYVAGDLAFGVADHQVPAAQRGALARLDARRADPRRPLIPGDFR